MQNCRDQRARVSGFVGLLHVLDERDEFREHHGSGAPHASVEHVEVGNVHDAVRRQDACALLPQHSVRRTQQRYGDLDQALNFVRGEIELRTLAA